MAKRHIPIIEKLGIGETASGLTPFVQTSTGDVQVQTPSGVQTIATAQTVATAVSKILVKDWQAATAIEADEVRRSTVAAGTIELGDLIRSNSTRTTGAAFDATEAGNWTEISPDLVTSVAGRTGAITLAIADTTGLQTALDGKADDSDLTGGSINAYFDHLRWDGATSISSTDLNTLLISGFYDGNTLTNAPNSATGWFYIIHQRHSNLADANWHHQTAYALGSGTGSVAGEVYIRTMTSGTWSAWTRIDNAAVALLEGTTVPVMNGTAAVGNAATSSRSNHVHPIDTSRAPLASPTLTGTIQLDGSPILGDGANHGQRSFSDVAGAAMMITNTTGTATSTIDNTDIAARFVKPGTASVKSNASMDIVVGSHTAGVNPATEVKFRLGNSGNTPTTDILTLRSDGSVLAGTNALATTAVATTSANGLMASTDKTKLDGVATGAEVNVQADWTQATSTDDSFIRNKPTVSALEGTTAPVMNGTAAVGTAVTSSRSDHVHGSDTAKANTTALTDGSVSAHFDELRFDNVRAISNTNLNDLNTSGFYDGNNLTNAPGASASWFYIEHLRHSNFADVNWRMQKAYGLGSPNSGFSAVGTMYIRTMASGTWSAWRTVTTTAT